MTAAANLAEVDQGGGRRRSPASSTPARRPTSTRRTAWWSAAVGPREYAPALSALEKGQKHPRQAAAPRRGRPRADGPGLGLPRRDRGRRPARPGCWSTRRSAATSSWSPGPSTPELNLRRIEAIFAAREQMLEFNVPVALALESMMVVAQGSRPGAPDEGVAPGRRPRRGRCSWSAVLVSRSTSAWSGGRRRLDGDAGGLGDPTLAPTPTPQPGSSEPPDAGPRRVLRPDARLGDLLPRRRRVRDARRCRSTTSTPTARRSSSPLLKVPADGPGRPDRLAGRQPRRSGRARHRLRRRRRLGVRRRCPRRLRHRRLRPARHRCSRPRSTASPTTSWTPTSPATPTRTPRTR